jgi:hypothetical protein
MHAIGGASLLRFNRQVLRNHTGSVADFPVSRWGIAGRSAKPGQSNMVEQRILPRNGKNWRFSKQEMGDWQFGKHYVPPFRLAEAVAASAVVPYAIGALVADPADETLVPHRPREPKACREAGAVRVHRAPLVRRNLREPWPQGPRLAKA